jgi:hypothetical protein
MQDGGAVTLSWSMPSAPLPEFPDNLRSGFVVAMWFTFLTLLAAPIAYYKVFTGFSFWDDEGDLMAVVNQILHGLRPYRDVSATYGPVYYLYACSLRLVTGTAVTHDAVRLSALLPWLVTPLLQAWFVLRATDSVAVATVAHFLTVFAVAFIANEPGHPQELGVMLLAAYFAAGFLIDSPRCRAAGLILVGALAAALALVKVNIGIFVALGAVIPLVSALPARALQRIALWSAVGAGLALPVLLMRAHFDDPRTVTFCACVVTGLAGCVVVLLECSRQPELCFRDAGTTLAAFAGVLAVALGMLRAIGVSFEKILYSLVLMHVHTNVQGRDWYFPEPLSPAWLPWTFGSLGLAILVMRLPRVRRAPIMAVARLFFGVGVVALWFARPGMTAGFAAGLCWLALLPAGEDGNASRVGRGILCVATILHLLVAYPIAGSQVGVASTPLLAIALICIGDSLAFARERLSAPLRNPRIATATVMVVMACLYGRRIVSGWRNYESLPSLGMPGALRVHVEPQQVEDYHWVVRQVQQYCDTFVGYPGVPSFHFWSGIEPPGRLNMDDWMLGLNDDEQRAVVRSLDQFPNACVVYNPNNVRFWLRAGQPASSFPLASYIMTEFNPVSHIHGYYLMVRKNRPWPPARDKM